jgi:hypothetical protein
VQESLTLEYKSADALGKAEGKKAEITKDVSAMANSAGGVIIYGIAEYNDPLKKHLPEKIDVVDLIAFPKEWLEQIINNIRPKIDSILIHPISIGVSPNSVVYVVEIPQSTTAHQALDWRYYKRYNFQSVPMSDYEIRDVMGRIQHPRIDLDFTIRYSQVTILKKKELVFIAKNIGQVYARFVKIVLFLPPSLACHKVSILNREIKEIDGVDYYIFSEINTRRDILDQDREGNQKHGSSWFEPIFPLAERSWIYRIPDNFSVDKHNSHEEILWEVYADNAPKHMGRVSIKDISYVREVAPANKVLRGIWQEKGNRVQIIFFGVIIVILLLVANWKLLISALP